MFVSEANLQWRQRTYIGANQLCPISDIDFVASIVCRVSNFFVRHQTDAEFNRQNGVWILAVACYKEVINRWFRAEPGSAEGWNPNPKFGS